MRNVFKLSVIALIFAVLPTASSYADWHDNGHGGDHGNYGHGHGWYGGRSYVGVDFSLWPDYYYGAPYYDPDAVLVSPPVYEPVVINGVTYYLNNGTYYMYNGYEYQPITPPVTGAVQAPAEVVQPSAPLQAPTAAVTPALEADTPDSITINIPNNAGGYTAVTLKKSGNGYVGPQGEFYPQFPSVAELKVIYGK